MAKLITDDVVNFQNEVAAATTINNNFAAVEAALEKTLTRDGTTPNTMTAQLDMNGQRIINLPAPVDPNDAVRKYELDNFSGEKGDKGDTGDTGLTGPAGWSPVFAIAENGTARVLQVVDWSGGEGSKPSTGNYVGPTGLTSNINSAVDVRGSIGASGTNGTNGTNGSNGTDGWSPVFSIVSDSARRVLQVSDWTGGVGTKPTTGLYVSASGLSATLANGVDIRGATGASGAGTGDMVGANNLSDVANTTTARSNLGLVIGTNVQAYDVELAAIAGLTSAANKAPYFTGSGTAALADLSSFGRSLIDDADATAARSTLGLVIGTNVQAYDAELAAIAGLTSAANKLPYFTGSGSASLADISTAGRALLDDADAAAQRTTLGLGAVATESTVPVANGGTGATTASAARTALGLAIGTDVQAYDTDLAAIAALTPTKGNVLVGNGTAWVSVGVGTDGQALVADSAEAAGLKWATASGGSSTWTTKFKTSNQTRTSSTTYTDDTELQFAVTSGQMLIFRAFYTVTYGAGGFIIGCNGPTASSIKTMAVVHTTNGGVGTSYNVPIFSSSTAAYSPTPAHIFGRIVFSASGTFALRVAQATSNAAVTTFESGSYIEYRLI